LRSTSNVAVLGSIKPAKAYLSARLENTSPSIQASPSTDVVRGHSVFLCHIDTTYVFVRLELVVGYTSLLGRVDIEYC
jgi:hypothetical protein